MTEKDVINLEVLLKLSTDISDIPNNLTSSEVLLRLPILRYEYSQFTSFGLKMALSREALPFVPGKLAGALDATEAHTEIFASYLTEHELAGLKAWFDSYLTLDKIAFDFEISDNPDSLSHPRLPIMELNRLVCGILMQEANLDFVLTTGDGRKLIVKVESISFGH